MTALATTGTALPDCRPLLADPDDLTLVFQPIVDLAAARIAGYEALSRFPGTATPDVWFAAAQDAGVGPELEALALHKALAARADLPPNTFLTVDVSPHLLGSAPVQDALHSVGDLARIVVELTEHTAVDDVAALRRQVADLRVRGALVALDDAGAGYSGPAADDHRPAAAGEAGPGAGAGHRQRPRAAGPGRAGGRVRRPDRRLAAGRGDRDARRARRLRPAGHAAGAGLAARPARPRASPSSTPPSCG